MIHGNALLSLAVKEALGRHGISSFWPYMKILRGASSSPATYQLCPAGQATLAAHPAYSWGLHLLGDGRVSIADVEGQNAQARAARLLHVSCSDGADAHADDLDVNSPVSKALQGRMQKVTGGRCSKHPGAGGGL